MTLDPEDPPILDVRDAAAFERGHRPGAVNIPVEELLVRAHELAPRDVAVIVYDEQPTRARWAASRLRARGRAVAAVFHGADRLGEQAVETGPSRARLWRPHALLKDAMSICRGLRAAGSSMKSHGLQVATGDSTRRAVRFSTNQPTPSCVPRALDIACGAGRDAVFLAMQGFDVEAWDLLPDALEKCNDLARRNGVAVQTVRRDVERYPELPADAFDLVCCFNFLHRPLVPWIARAVRPGGWIVYETFVEPQREVFGKPSRAEHVLKPGELAAAFAGMETIVYREGMTGPRRIAASLIARRRE